MRAKGDEMLKFIARLARPIVEEAIEQIYARRAAQAENTHTWGRLDFSGELDPAEVARAMDKAVRSGMHPRC